MKKAINIWSFPATLSLGDKLRLARQAGFEGFEIDLSDVGPLTLKSSPKEIAEARALAEQAGVQLSAVATGLYWSANPASADPAVRSRAEAILNKQIEVAHALDLDAILVVPGTVGADFIPSCEVIPYDIAWQRATSFLRAALPAAKKAGVRICVENVWNKFLLSPLEMQQFVDQFDSEWIGVYFDVGNCLASGYPEHWIPVLGRQIRRVHLKDYRRAVGSVDGFVEILSGDVNWPAVMRGLGAIGYDGWLTAEMIPPIPFYKHAPETLLFNTSRAMDALLALSSHEAAQV
ncbi:MAG TPA: sugar phosphate isomerase/epimerase family protein [Terracidiphilus sp.]|nr:sugar phosphate isomerase/epimerase family protein [Terracidiphilus sp.]